MARVDVHVAHDEFDFVDDGFACRFDAQHGAHFEHGVAFGKEGIDAFGVHACEEAVAFDEEGVTAVVVGFDDGA